jgi:FMS-like tyrosine kinase 1
LGSGAFGIVMKGEAEEIVPGEKRTTVAVKMVKTNADETHIKALMSELKIMVHLGQHVNVVNLLGACTESLARKRKQ